MSCFNSQILWSVENTDMREEWAKFVIANRVPLTIANELGLVDSNRDFKYDVVIGGTADGSVASIASDLRYHRLNPQKYVFSVTDFLKRDGSSYGTQMAFCTNRALACIEYIKCDIM